MSSDRSEKSTGSHHSIVLGGPSRRNPSRTPVGDLRTSRRSSGAPRQSRHSSGAPRHSRRSSGAPRQSHHSPASPHRGSRRRRSRRSPPRVETQARSRSRSVVTHSLRRRTLRTPSTDTHIYERTNRVIDHSHNRQRRHRLQTPRRDSVNRSRSPVRSGINDRFISVTPQPPSIDVNNELLKCIKESLQSILAVNPQSKERFADNNVVPEFDPKSKNQTILTWLIKVKECSEIYGWDSQQTAHYALPKLVGTAKKWYEGQPSVLLAWEEWVEKLKSAFPSHENYGSLLTEMLTIRAKFGDDLEGYYYEKLIALNRCNIMGKNAVDCIVYGIDDRSVRFGAEAVGFSDADKLLGYLRGVKHERLDRFNKKPVRSSNETRKPVKHNVGRVLTCYNCHETGHYVSGCKKPIVKCQKCKRIGHDNPKCDRSVWVDKSEVKTL